MAAMQAAWKTLKVCVRDSINQIRQKRAKFVSLLDTRSATYARVSINIMFCLSELVLKYELKHSFNAEHPIDATYFTHMVLFEKYQKKKTFAWLAFVPKIELYHTAHHIL